MGIPREFPFLKWRFLGIPRNSHTGEVYWLYRGDFYLQGGIVLFTGRYLLIAPLNILTCDFKTRRERALKAAIRGQYEYYRRVYFSFLYCHTSHTLELELELIQTQMTQKPMLRAEVYARALRASQNRKEDSL